MAVGQGTVGKPGRERLKAKSGPQNTAVLFCIGYSVFRRNGMPDKMKYETLPDLKVAYDRGEIDREFTLRLDNDHSFLFLPAAGNADADPTGEWVKVYEGDETYRDEELLSGMGIPCEPC